MLRIGVNQLVDFAFENFRDRSRFYTSHFGKEQRHIRGLSGYRQLQFYRVVFRQLLERLERVADSSKYLRHQPQDYWLDIRGFVRKRETTVVVFPNALFLG